MEKNFQFQSISEYNRSTFVGKRLGTNFFDIEIGFRGADFRKIEEIIKNSKDYQDKFNKICLGIENGVDYSEFQASFDKNLDSITNDLEVENKKLVSQLEDSKKQSEERERNLKARNEELLKSNEDLKKEIETLKQQQNSNSKIENKKKRKAETQQNSNENENSTKKRKIE